MKSMNLSGRITAVLIGALFISMFAGCGAEHVSAHPIIINNSGSGAQVSSAEPFAVASSSIEATEVGMEILRNGGNAVDAAVAISLTLAVVEPYASGIGGGGFMLVYDPADDSAWSVDYFASSGSAIEKTDDIAIPGLLKGMQTVLEKWGTVDFSDLIQPAIDYAIDGFSVSNTFLHRLKRAEEVAEDPLYTDLKAGDILRQPELAQTLLSIQQNGIEVFYNGKIAEDIASVCGLTTEDLSGYQVYRDPAIRADILEHTFYGTYAPSSAITTMQFVKMAEMLDIPSPEDDTAGYMNKLKVITNAVYTSRIKTLVDPRIYDWDYQSYLTEDYLDSMIDPASAAIEADPEKKCTTQFSVIDSNGMTVCVTNTLSDNWGSFTRVDGFYLNNSMSLFGKATKPAYAPNKRPRTHFSPLIITGSDGEIMAIGSPGGNNIPRIIAPVLIDILIFGTDVQTAVDRSRVFIDDTGYACVEAEDSAPSIVCIKDIPFGYYYSGSHMYFGCTSIVGYSPQSGIYCVNDARRITSDTTTTVEHFFGW